MMCDIVVCSAVADRMFLLEKCVRELEQLFLANVTLDVMGQIVIALLMIALALVLRIKRCDV